MAEPESRGPGDEVAPAPFRSDHGADRTGLAHRVGQLSGRRRGGDRDGHRAHQPDGREDLGAGEVRRCLHDDRVAGLHARAGQPLGAGAGPLEEFAQRHRGWCRRLPGRRRSGRPDGRAAGLDRLADGEVGVHPGRPPRAPAGRRVTSQGEGADEIGQHERPVALHGVAGAVDDHHLERGQAALHFGEVLVPHEGRQSAAHEEGRDA